MLISGFGAGHILKHKKKPELEEARNLQTGTYRHFPRYEGRTKNKNDILDNRTFLHSFGVEIGIFYASLVQRRGLTAQKQILELDTFP